MSTGKNLHIDAPMSNIAVRQFDAGATGGGNFIAPFIFPSVPVGHQSDKYYIISKEAFFKIHNTRRSTRTKANRIEFDVSSDSYYAQEYGLATDYPLQDLSNADMALDLRMNGTDLVTTGLLRDFERRTANKITSISNVGSGVALTGTAKWSDFVSSDPVADVTTGHAFMRMNTGLTANTAIIDTDTLTILRRHPALLEMYKNVAGGELNDMQLATLFKVNRILVGDSIMDNQVEGGTASMTNIWGNNCILAHIRPPAGVRTVTFGLGFRWTPEGFPAPMQVGRQQFSGPGTENIEVLEAGYFQDEKIVARQLAYAITGTL